MRIISLLTLIISLGAGFASAQDIALVSEPQAMTKAIESVDGWFRDDESTPKDGFYPVLNGMITGAGWISAGPGYRKHLFDGRALVDASAAISWRAYKIAQARFEVVNLAHDRVTLGTQVRWQDFTQVNYYGVGADSLETQRSEYRLKDVDVLGYGAFKANSWLSISGRFGRLQKPDVLPSSGPFDRDLPDTLDVFAEDPGVTQPSAYLHGNVSITADNRDHTGHPTAGGMYRAAVATYSDRDLAQFSFRRYDAEALQVVPIVGKKLVLALHGRGLFSDTSSGQTVPFYMLPSLGGGNTLRSYYDYRFHDRNLLIASAESRLALMSHLDAAVFVDAGNVAARARDLDLAKTSVGAGLRVHTGTSTMGRLDIAHGREGWRLFFSLNDPFRLSRRSEIATVAPFVP